MTNVHSRVAEDWKRVEIVLKLSRGGLLLHMVSGGWPVFLLAWSGRCAPACCGCEAVRELWCEGVGSWRADEGTESWNLYQVHHRITEVRRRASQHLHISQLTAPGRFQARSRLTDVYLQLQANRRTGHPPDTMWRRSPPWDHFKIIFTCFQSSTTRECTFVMYLTS